MNQKQKLLELIDQYAEARHIQGHSTYNIKTAAARKAVIEALSGVQALSAAPAIKPLVWSDESGPTDKIRYNHITAETALGQFSVEWKGWKEEDGPCVYLAGDYVGVASNLGGAKQLAEQHIRELVANLLAASPTPKAEQTSITPETGNSASAKGAAITSESGTPPARPRHAPGTPTAEQQTQTGAVDRTGCTAGTDEECTRRGCATSCPAQQAAPKAAPVVWLSSKQLRGVTALHGQYLPFRRQPEGRFDTPVYLEQAATKAAPGEPSYSEKWDAELGRTAMRFVDRAGDVHPGIDDAETICAEFYKAMSEVIERMPHVQRMTPRKAAPGELAESAAKGAIMGAAYDFRDAHISGSMNLKRSAHAALEAAVDNALAAPQQEAQEPVAWESTTPGYIKYITQARCEKFSPAVRRWYKPYRCSGCAERGAGFDACDIATAAAQGFRDGQSTTKQEE